MTKDEALKMAIEYIDKLKSTGQTNWFEINVIQNACKEVLADNSFCKHGLPKGLCRLGEKDCE
jgi:hypothetical protein